MHEANSKMQFSLFTKSARSLWARHLHSSRVLEARKTVTGGKPREEVDDLSRAKIPNISKTTFRHLKNLLHAGPYQELYDRARTLLADEANLRPKKEGKKALTSRQKAREEIHDMRNFAYAKPVGINKLTFEQLKEADAGYFQAEWDRCVLENEADLRKRCKKDGPSPPRPRYRPWYFKRASSSSGRRQELAYLLRGKRE